MSAQTPQIQSKTVATCELMVHPGYRTGSEGGCGPAGPDDFSQSADREHEMDMLAKMASDSFYNENNIELISFHGLKYWEKLERYKTRWIFF